MFISIKTTSPDEGNLKVERIWNSGTQFFLCLVETFGARVVHHVEETCTSRYFFQNHEPNRAPLSYLQNVPIYYPSFREIKTFNSFLLRVLLHNRFCAQYFTPLKKMLGAWYKHVQNFSALSFTTIWIEPFRCNNTIFYKYPF